MGRRHYRSSSSDSSSSSGDDDKNYNKKKNKRVREADEEKEKEEYSERDARKRDSDDLEIDRRGKTRRDRDRDSKYKEDVLERGDGDRDKDKEDVLERGNGKRDSEDSEIDRRGKIRRDEERGGRRRGNAEVEEDEVINRDFDRRGKITRDGERDKDTKYRKRVNAEVEEDVEINRDSDRRGKTTRDGERDKDTKFRDGRKRVNAEVEEDVEIDRDLNRRGKSTRDGERDKDTKYRDSRKRGNAEVEGEDEDRYRRRRRDNGDDKNGRRGSRRRRDESDGRLGGRSRYDDVDEIEEGQIRNTREEDDDRRSEFRNKRNVRERRDKDDVGDFSKEKGGDNSKKEGGQGGKGNVEARLPPPPPPPSDNLNLGRTGGVYIPPFKLARMLKQVEDKSSVEYQRLTWDALRKSINGLVNKVNATNIKNIIPELFAENLIRGRGLFCRSCIKSQMASPGFTDVFAALVAVVNTKFPQVGDLLLRRIILQLQRAYKRNDKPQLLAAVKFIAHLVNQQIVHELVALELLTTLLENPTDDSVEVAVGFVTQCGSILQDLCPRGLHGIFERFRGILHEGEIDKRVQFLIEGLFAIRKAKFQGYPAIRPELDLVEQEDQLTHEISLLDQIDPEIALDIFKPDPQFIENEQRYEELKKTLLGEESDDEADSDAATDDEDDEDDEDEQSDEEQMRIRDETETNLVNLRRTIYLTIMSSVDFEEAGHKLLKIKLEPGQEMELCIMLLECCSQERTYLRYYGLLGQRFCLINKIHQVNFEKCFVQQYSMIHRLETNKLRNVAKFFAHLLGTDALPWQALAYIRLTEEATTSSSRIFIKILFQELSEHLGIRLLNERLSDPTMQDTFESIFPRDNPKNTRFSINFFTSIGLGGITENLREYLKNMPRLIMQQQKPVSESEDDSDSTGSSDSDASSSDSESASSSASESESDDRQKKRRRRR